MIHENKRNIVLQVRNSTESENVEVSQLTDRSVITLHHSSMTAPKSFAEFTKPSPTGPVIPDFGAIAESANETIINDATSIATLKELQDRLGSKHAIIKPTRHRVLHQGTLFQQSKHEQHETRA